VNKINISIVCSWPIISESRRGFAELMVNDCKQQPKHERIPKLAFSMNGQALSLAESNREFHEAMKYADYIQADGQSIVFASQYLSKNKLPERIATTDFFHDAARIAIDSNIRFYLLGASEEELTKAIHNIKSLYPSLTICGFRNGFFSEDEEKEICLDIIQKKTDVLWLGLGKPKEQLFCIKHKKELKGVAWIKTCGGLFDFLSSKSSRAPNWMQKFGLEWLYRLLQDPYRLFWRYFITNTHSIYIIIKHFIKEYLYGH